MTNKEKPKMQKGLLVNCEHFLNEYKVNWVGLGSSEIEQIFSFSFRTVNYT
jgi:hypothetical protein